MVHVYIYFVCVYVMYVLYMYVYTPHFVRLILDFAGIMLTNIFSETIRCLPHIFQISLIINIHLKSAQQIAMCNHTFKLSNLKKKIFIN
jgi:hypothetical protein